jgi:hypothetical protein
MNFDFHKLQETRSIFKCLLKQYNKIRHITYFNLRVFLVIRNKILREDAVLNSGSSTLIKSVTLWSALLFVF